MAMGVSALLMLMQSSIYILSFNLIMLTGFLFCLTSLTSSPQWNWLLFHLFSGKECYQTNKHLSTNNLTNLNICKKFQQFINSTCLQLWKTQRVDWVCSQKPNYCQLIYSVLLLVLTNSLSCNKHTKTFQCPCIVLSHYTLTWKGWHLSFFKLPFNAWNFFSLSSELITLSPSMIKFLHININVGRWKMQGLSHLMIYISGKKRFRFNRCSISQTQFLMNFLIIGSGTSAQWNGGMIFG